ncbi:MAG: globin family protein [Gallionellaceae bacterium]|nr:globin family protein [Gallionellaceae bacterium]MDD5365247.1 globin family protein [Gallionellaceae bacterium]
MTPEQIALIQSSWTKVVPIKDTAAELFYGKLFELDPAVKPMFRGDMKEQGRKLMASLNVVVNGITNLGDLVPNIQEMGRRHVAYGVEAKHYDTVGAAILWTLEQGLGEDFTPATREAWTIAYTTLANVMKEAAYVPA